MPFHKRFTLFLMKSFNYFHFSSLKPVYDAVTVCTLLQCCSLHCDFTTSRVILFYYLLFSFINFPRRKDLFIFIRQPFKFHYHLQQLFSRGVFQFRNQYPLSSHFAPSNFKPNLVKVVCVINKLDVNYIMRGLRTPFSSPSVFGVIAFS